MDIFPIEDLNSKITGMLIIVGLKAFDGAINFIVSVQIGLRLYVKPKCTNLARWLIVVAVGVFVRPLILLHAVIELFILFFKSAT